MICYPNGVPNQVDGSEPDNKQIIQRVLQNLDIWGLRVSLLELQLLFKQATTQQVRTRTKASGQIDQTDLFEKMFQYIIHVLIGFVSF